MIENLTLPTAGFKPSANQSAFFDWVSTGTGSAILNAVAGSGKTTTIVHACDLIDPSESITFLAFNKKIATELAKRLPKHARAATFHAAGFNAWRFVRKNVDVQADKVRNLAERLFTVEEMERFGSMAVKAVAHAKNAGVGILHPDELPIWKEIAERFDLEPADQGTSLDVALERASALLAASVEAALAKPSVIDFDDMIYMPLLKGVGFYRVDWLIVDEAQDTNGVQLEMLKRMIKPTGRLVAVGDRHQAIYAFRGADSTAMDNIKRTFRCEEMPLDVSYRCSQNVVREAQRLVPHIKFSDTAAEGRVMSGSLTPTGSWNYRESISDDCMAEDSFRPSDVIVCRNVAPLVELAYKFIGNRIGCKVLGREIGAALVTLINKMKAKGVDALIEKLEAFTAREKLKFLAKRQDAKAEAAQDRLDCILAVVRTLDENHRTVPAVVSSIQAMFSDDDGKGILTLCTCHKSKGLEWDRVFIYKRDLMPSKYAKQDWQREQEANLEYVAITRAKHTLVWFNS